MTTITASLSSTSGLSSLTSDDAISRSLTQCGIMLTTLQRGGLAHDSAPLLLLASLTDALRSYTVDTVGRIEPITPTVGPVILPLSIPVILVGVTTGNDIADAVERIIAVVISSVRITRTALKAQGFTVAEILSACATGRITETRVGRGFAYAPMTDLTATVDEIPFGDSVTDSPITEITPTRSAPVAEIIAPVTAQLPRYSAVPFDGGVFITDYQGEREIRLTLEKGGSGDRCTLILASRVLDTRWTDGVEMTVSGLDGDGMLGWLLAVEGIAGPTGWVDGADKEISALLS